MITRNNDVNASVNDILSSSLQAERQGVAVDWKQTCMTVCNAASQYIAACEQRVQALEQECVAGGLREVSDVS